MQTMTAANESQSESRQCQAEGCNNVLSEEQWKASKNKFCATCNARLALEEKKREGK